MLGFSRDGNLDQSISHALIDSSSFYYFGKKAKVFPRDHREGTGFKENDIVEVVLDRI